MVVSTHSGASPKSEYNPTPRIADLLDWCHTRIQAAPYNVTLRWTFYRAVQEKGLLKEDYGNFKKWLSRARKGFYNGWSPASLVDDTRQIIYRGYGYESWDHWVQSFADKTCTLEKYSGQKKIVQMWFEAEAMKSQFEYLANRYHVSLVPLRGDASIDQKYKVAQSIRELYDAYEKPVVILYFGDYDPKGFQIPESASRDVRSWCGEVPYTFIRCGINADHLTRYSLPENPERPGQYQWEALPESAAEEIVRTNIEQHWDLEKVREVEREEGILTERWRSMVSQLLDQG